MTIKEAIPENTLSEEAKNELNKVKEIEKKVDRENLYYKTNRYKHNFQNFRTVSAFGRDIYIGTITIKETSSVKKVFLEILQNSQENTCARISFLIKLQASGDCFCAEKRETSIETFFAKTIKTRCIFIDCTC